MILLLVSRLLTYTLSFYFCSSAKIRTAVHQQNKKLIFQKKWRLLADFRQNICWFSASLTEILAKKHVCWGTTVRINKKIQTIRKKFLHAIRWVSRANKLIIYAPNRMFQISTSLEKHLKIISNPVWIDFSSRNSRRNISNIRKIFNFLAIFSDRS